MDATNIPDYNPTSDAIQLRPFEVLCEVISPVFQVSNASTLSFHFVCHQRQAVNVYDSDLEMSPGAAFHAA